MRYASVRKRLLEVFSNAASFTMQQAYEAVPEKPQTTVRGRIYENVGKCFEKIARNTFRVSANGCECILFEGNGRNPESLGIKSGSINLIVTDHPWADPKSLKGGNRNFANYDTFRYTQEDFVQKANLLADGCFCVEILPAESESNYQYLYEIKEMAAAAGLNYYASVDWKKGDFVANTGRKAKNTETVMIFVKGKARALRPDVKKDLAEPDVKHYMSGSKRMLPTQFDYPIVSKKDRLHQAEKPLDLMLEIIDLLSMPGEWVLDQFAGSGVVGEACMKSDRNCYLIELCKESVEKIVKRLHLVKDESLTDVGCA